MITLENLLAATKRYKSVRCYIQQKDGKTFVWIFSEKSFFRLEMEGAENNHDFEELEGDEIDIPELHDWECFTVAAAYFHGCCDWVSASASKDKTKLTLGCINVTIRETGLSTAATDGTMLSYTGSASSPIIAHVNVPVLDYKIIKTLKLAGELRIGDNTITSEGFYYSEAIPNNYPQYGLLIPLVAPRSYRLGECAAACDHLRTFGKKTVKLSWSYDRLIIEDKPFDGSASGNFSDFQVNFQADLLRRALTKTNQIVFTGGRLDQVLFDPFESKSHLLMPAR